MYLLAWILVGAVVGWGTGRVLQGNGYGPFMDTLVGAGGALAGGSLIGAAGIGGYRGVIITTMVAVIGAALLTVLTASVNGRRIYAAGSENLGRQTCGHSVRRRALLLAGRGGEQFHGDVATKHYSAQILSF
jgi:uncharacterized membrane protein YeaQ/YmgE (transglycosylase-associated protein family)